MTDADLFTEYLAREKRAMATPQGACIEGIMRDLSTETGRAFEDVRRVVAEFTINNGAG
ncbi:hypothetical protein JF540_22755 [Salipiger thiooxidans]|uniref:hypothetical protein n=1 Tax=Salipiger thiooxidans TaxID=282683 RepID=UPI001A8C82F0|nr:hypothetical protein [Salipiger thiooxidans]MBN8189510.1 hypothetical protein [Salipiger thiooxidans]